MNFANKDSEEEESPPAGLGKQDPSNVTVDNDPGFNESSELFALLVDQHNETNLSPTLAKDDPDVIHVDNSSDLVALSTSLNDLEIAPSNIDWSNQIDVTAPPDFIDMSADVARGHGGDGGGDDRPPPYQDPPLPIFDLRPHMESDRLATNLCCIQQSPAKRSTIARSCSQRKILVPEEDGLMTLTTS
ncbi:hypothetical protein Tco_0163518 [Tanacetum coccineum]